MIENDMSFCMSSIDWKRMCTIVVSCHRKQCTSIAHPWRDKGCQPAALQSSTPARSESFQAKTRTRSSVDHRPTKVVSHEPCYCKEASVTSQPGLLLYRRRPSNRHTYARDYNTYRSGSSSRQSLSGRCPPAINQGCPWFGCCCLLWRAMERRLWQFCGGGSDG